MISSGLIKNTRLISVVLGTRNTNERDQASDTLLTYGFRFFETLTFHAANTPFTEATVWGGQNNTVQLASSNGISATIPKSASSHVHLNINKNKSITAPIHTGDVLGEATIELNNQVLHKSTLLASNPVEQSSWYRRFYSLTKLRIHQWMHP